jgi:hypothetical protein
MLGANDLYRAGGGEPSLLSPDNFYKPAKASRFLGELLQSTQIGRHVVLWREMRAARPRTTPYFDDEVRRQAALPPLPAPLRMGAAALAGYARNVVSLAGLCQAHGIAVVFTTQPTMVTRQPTAEERAVLWGFHTGTHNVSPENFADLLDAVNRCLTETCAARGYACVDLAGTIPPGLGHFYDQVHFNEAGARLVAETLAPRLREVLAKRRR